MDAMEELDSEDKGVLNQIKCWFLSHTQHLNFFTILVLASILWGMGILETMAVASLFWVGESRDFLICKHANYSMVFNVNIWAAIASSSYLPQRTDNDIENYWNTHLKKKLKKLQQGSSSEGSFEEGFSASQRIPRGQWERRLQTDIHMAKRALSEALSPENLSASNPSNSNSLSSTKQPQSFCYASSADNIARMLKGWMKNPPKCSCTNSAVTQIPSTSWLLEGLILLQAKEQREAVLNCLRNLNPCLVESLESSNSEFSQSLSPEATVLQDESKPDIGAEMPFSLLDKWLLDGFTIFLFCHGLWPYSSGETSFRLSFGDRRVYFNYY